MRGNKFVGYNGSGTDGGKPLVAQHCPEYTWIVGNIIEGTGGDCDQCFGIVVSASEIDGGTPLPGLKVHGNLIYDTYIGLQLGEGGNDYIGDDAEIYNNTFHNQRSYLDDEDPPEWHHGSGMKVRTDVGEAMFHNNLVDLAANDDTVMISCGSGCDLSGATVSHNGWFADDSDQYSTCDDVCDNSTDTTGADPTFEDQPNDDYRLDGASACINAGVDVNLKYNGSAPDLGAFEYLPSGGGPHLVDIDTCPATHQLCEFEQGQ